MSISNRDAGVAGWAALGPIHIGARTSEVSEDAGADGVMGIKITV